MDCCVHFILYAARRQLRLRQRSGSAGALWAALLKEVEELVAQLNSIGYHKHGIDRLTEHVEVLLRIDALDAALTVDDGSVYEYAQMPETGVMVGADARLVLDDRLKLELRRAGFLANDD